MTTTHWIPARELRITWSEDQRYWKWSTTSPDQSDSSCTSACPDPHDESLVIPECGPVEVAELKKVSWLEIVGLVDVRSLEVKTSYSAFLVFKIQGGSKELERATASVRFTKEITDGSGDEGYSVFIDKKKSSDGDKGRFPRHRSDGWSEIKLGEFFVDSCDDGEVELRLFEKKNKNWKSGLVVRGIGLKPNN